MAIKFNQLTFDVKDIILIVGIVVYLFRFENKQDVKFAELKAEIQQIISDNKVNEVKVNARFDSMKTSNKQADTCNIINFVAILHENRIEVLKKKLFKYKLV